MIQKEEEEFRASDPDLMEESFEGRRDAKVTTLSDSESGDKSIDFVPLYINRGPVGPRGHTATEGTVAIMENISLSDLQKMTDLFYEKAFQDETLDKFIQSHDDPHGSRFAKWIHQKLSGSTIWDEDRAARRRKNEEVTLANGETHLVHDRTSAHVAAWHSPKRPRHESGRHFKLDECRVWMRLHFWAMRESGLMEKSPSFADYYVRFIGHFVSVYESKAPFFTRDSLRWSASPENIDRYIHRDGRRMTDVLGLNFQTSLSQLPPSEANDLEWPYNLTPTTATTNESEEGVQW